MDVHYILSQKVLSTVSGVPSAPIVHNIERMEPWEQPTMYYSSDTFEITNTYFSQIYSLVHHWSSVAVTSERQ